MFGASNETRAMTEKRFPPVSGCPAPEAGSFLLPDAIPLGNDLDTGLMNCVNVGGEMAPRNVVRPLRREWVRDLYLEAKSHGIEFYFHQTGSMFLRDGSNLGAWNLNRQIACAESARKKRGMPRFCFSDKIVSPF